MRKEWTSISEDVKFVYVMMSRADRERAIYTNRLAQIRHNLVVQFPEAVGQQTVDAQKEPPILSKFTSIFGSEAEFGFDANCV